MFTKIRNNKTGFTLVEVMIVLGIISMLAVLSMPNFLRARANTNEAGAMAALKALASAFWNYWMSNIPHLFPSDFSQLTAGNPPYIDESFSDGEKYGYDFSIDATSGNAFRVYAVPSSYRKSGERAFMIDTSGTLFYAYLTEGQSPSDDGVDWTPLGGDDSGGAGGGEVGQEDEGGGCVGAACAKKPSQGGSLP